MSKYWQLTRDENNIAWLDINIPDKTVNILNYQVMDELDAKLQSLEQELPAGVIFHSSKASGFIAGADINAFSKLEDKAQALSLIRQGQAIMDRIEYMRCPTLALIHGFALGGGLELALACTYRVAEEKAKLSLPEVKLGIHPGFGGSVRLPRLIGARKGLRLILNGKAVNGHTAKNIGLVDASVALHQLQTAAVSIITKAPHPVKAGFLQQLLFYTPFRQVVAAISRKALIKKVRLDHYPAPYAQLDVWSNYGGNIREMMEAEAQSVAHLITGQVAQNLMRTFFLQQRLKGIAANSKTQQGISHVHVIGAGAMGGDIAAWCAIKGFVVSLQDLNIEMIAVAIKRAVRLCEIKKISAIETTAILDRLIPDSEGIGISSADIVIEAITENAKVKQDLFKQLEEKSRPDTVLATNTSSIPLETITKGMKTSGRVVGLHFFNPVARMPLVEIVAGSKSSKASLSIATAFIGRLDHYPLPVKSAPGFLVNRILMPYLMEAILMVSEGIDISLIDRVATDFGMPVGPVLLADTVGLDVCVAVGQVLGKAYGLILPDILMETVEQGHFGRKTGSGFYRHEVNSEPLPIYRGRPENIPEKDIQDRLIFSLLNEAHRCLNEGTVEDSDLLDAGMIFGTGFAPFRGGPICYELQRGEKEVKRRFGELKKAYGKRFKKVMLS